MPDYAFDNKRRAAILHRAIRLEIQEIHADIEYESATTFCDNCPIGDDWNEDSPDVCCKETGQWFEVYASDHEHIKFLESLLPGLATLAGEELEKVNAEPFVKD